MILGFIGFGEVGFELARGLKQEGLTEIIAFDPCPTIPALGRSCWNVPGKPALHW